MPVANIIPNPKEIAIGIKNRAWRDVSKIMGAKPPKVVSVVNNMERNRFNPAARIASWEDSPFFDMSIGKLDKY